MADHLNRPGNPRTDFLRCGIEIALALIDLAQITKSVEDAQRYRRACLNLHDRVLWLMSVFELSLADQQQVKAELQVLKKRLSIG